MDYTEQQDYNLGEMFTKTAVPNSELGVMSTYVINTLSMHPLVISCDGIKSDIKKGKSEAGTALFTHSVTIDRTIHKVDSTREALILLSFKKRLEEYDRQAHEVMATAKGFEETPELKTCKYDANSDYITIRDSIDRVVKRKGSTSSELQKAAADLKLVVNRTARTLRRLEDFYNYHTALCQLLLQEDMQKKLALLDLLGVFKRYYDTIEHFIVLLKQRHEAMKKRDHDLSKIRILQRRTLMALAQYVSGNLFFDDSLEEIALTIKQAIESSAARQKQKNAERKKAVQADEQRADEQKGETPDGEGKPDQTGEDSNKPQGAADQDQTPPKDDNANPIDAEVTPDESGEEIASDKTEQETPSEQTA